MALEKLSFGSKLFKIRNFNNLYSTLLSIELARVLSWFLNIQFYGLNYLI